MKIKERFPGIKDKNLIEMMERAHTVNPIRKRITDDQANRLKKYWSEITYILSERGLEITLSEDCKKMKIFKYE